MGLFNSYQKEGKGVEKNAMRPIRPLYFFELFFRKFSKLLLINLIYIGLTLPIWIAVVMFLFNDNLQTNFSIQYVGGWLRILAMVFLLFSPLIGPATAGMTYILKSFANEMPVFMVSEFFEHFKKNFKQSTLLTLLNGVFLLSFSLTLSQGDSSLMLFGGETSLGILRMPLLVFLVVLTFVNYYAFSMMVMFRLKLIDILKNSFIFALAKLPLNLLILVLIVVISYAAFYYPMIGLLLTALILYAFCGFLVVFSVYPTIEKHMLIPAQKQELNETKTEENKQE